MLQDMVFCVKEMIGRQLEYSAFPQIKKKKKVKRKCNRKYKTSKVSELIIAECVTM